ncbi:MAG: site-specific integrase [Arenimonas sp.]|jgi:integrase
MSLKLYRRGEIWHYRGTIGPAEKRCRLGGSCKTGDRDQAARQVAEIEARYWKGCFDGPGSILTFAQAAALFEAAGKPTTFLEPIKDYFKETLVKDITSGTVRTMAIELYGHCSGASRNRLAITPTQSVINFNAESDRCSPIRVKRFKAETKVKVPATLQWVKAFAVEAPAHLGAYALFMFLTGCRPSEALNVRWEDISLNGCTALIRETKVSTERTAHLPTSLVTALANIPRVNDRPVFIYRTYDDMMQLWNATIERAKIPRLTPHCCRHGFATELLRAGVDVVTVAWLGGWSSPAQVFKTYGHALKDRTLTDVLTGTKLTQPILAAVESLEKTA